MIERDRMVNLSWLDQFMGFDAEWASCSAELDTVLNFTGIWMNRFMRTMKCRWLESVAFVVASKNIATIMRSFPKRLLRCGHPGRLSWSHHWKKVAS